MKKIIKFTVCILLIFTASGCKKDSMEGISIYTTTYPIEYITNKLYGDYSTINSIYPNEIIELTDKLISDYSKSDLFVYNGLSNEKNYAVSMINENKNIRIVDANMGMEVNNNNIEELWLNPSNFLMLCLNIRNGMKEYITNSFLRKEIDNNYEKLKLEVSLLDADIKLLIENAKEKDILVSNDTFKFLEKYGLNVISIEDSKLSEKEMSELKNKITNKEIKYIIMLDNDIISDNIQTMLDDNNIEKLYFDSLSVLTNENRNNGKDYINIMNDNLEILKKELYD